MRNGCRGNGSRCTANGMQQTGRLPTKSVPVQARIATRMQRDFILDVYKRQLCIGGRGRQTRQNMFSGWVVLIHKDHLPCPQYLSLIHISSMRSSCTSDMLPRNLPKQNSRQRTQTRSGQTTKAYGRRSTNSMTCLLYTSHQPFY